MIIDEKLKQWATPAQAGYIDAVNEHGGKRPAARALGIHRRMIDKGVAAVVKKASYHGYAPEHGLRHPAPPGRFVPKTTVQFGANGEVKNEWVRFNIDDEQFIASVQEAIASFLEGVTPVKVPTAPRNVQDDIIPWIQIGDAHLGMLAHAAETGQNFDLKIAEAELCGAIGMLIDEAPKCERMVINDLGDFTHYENFKAQSEAAGNQMDYDGRFPKMIKVYSRVMRWIIDRALTKAQTVDVIVNQGNHSRTNDIWMAELLRVAYGNTKRVNILNNDSVFIGYRMGNTMVMIHHSDKCPPARLISVLTTDFREDFGETQHHYIDIGHIHHRMVSKEHPGVVLESWNNLAPNDKWHADAGYRSRQLITMVLRSRQYGEVGRRTLPIQEVWDRMSIKAAPAKRAFAA